MTPIGTAAVMVAAVVGTAVVGLLVRWVDRKVTAKVQWRVGPPVYQPFADLVKLLGKETLVPAAGNRWGFLLAPVVGFAAVAVSAALLVAVHVDPQGGFVGDLVVLVYILAIPSLAVILGASSSGNPHAGLGASREMKLVLSYELVFVLALLTVIIRAGSTLSLGAVLEQQWDGRAMLLYPSGLIGFVVAILAMQAKVGAVPFDIAEAETEIMGGVFVEYSGHPLALIHLTRAMLLAILPATLVTVFWGGFGPGPLGLVLGVVKLVVIVAIMVVIRNTNPRLRIDQALKFFWFLLAPMAMVAVVLAMAGY